MEERMMGCEACGHAVCSRQQAYELISREYKVSWADVATAAVWHIECAIADGRISRPDECPDDFYWEL